MLPVIMMCGIIIALLFKYLYKSAKYKSVIEFINKGILRISANTKNIQASIQEKNKTYSMQYATNNLIKAMEHLKGHRK